jgi:ribosomal protein S18 acetylase RimI-like enzyme
VTRWHPDHAIAHLSLVASHYRPLDAQELRDRLAEVQADGYHGVVTTAIAPPDQAVFLDCGFRVVERLHLLQHSFDHVLPWGPVPTRRAWGRDRQAILDVDRAAFEPFWQLDDISLAEALAATRSVRWRVARGPRHQVVGYAICGRSGRRGYVQRLAVHPDHQRRGIGASLLADGLRWLARRGAQDAMVNTQIGNQRSLRLYQRAGFVLQPGGLAVLRVDFTARR